MLSPDERRALLRIARASLEAAASGSDYAVPDDTSPTLAEPAAAFVTLKNPDGSLRGCIGQTEAAAPLARMVAQMARSAAIHDPRFSPVQPDEASGLRIDISVLSPLEPIVAGDVAVGVHGLAVERGGLRGLLLPQVAVDQRWDRETFLDATCQKARLPHDAWRDPGTRLWGFTAEVFGEDDAP